MPDYTYLQAAQPTTAGHWLLSFAHPVLRDAQRIAADFATINAQPGGRGRGQRLALPAGPRAARATARVRRADRAHARRACGRPTASPRPCGTPRPRPPTRAASPRTSSSTAATSSGCSQIGDALCRASALMPQKRNPYALVVIRGAAGTLLGRATGVLATQRTPSGPHGQPALRLRRGRAERSSSPRARSTSPRRSRRACASTARPARERWPSSHAMAADVAEVLCLEHGLDYRSAYRVVGRAVARRPHAAGLAAPRASCSTASCGSADALAAALDPARRARHPHGHRRRRARADGRDARARHARDGATPRTRDAERRRAALAARRSGSCFSSPSG